jgi:hypothetical protein
VTIDEKNAPVMPPVGQPLDLALRAANAAFAGRQRREANRFASIELRFSDPKAGPWEAAALVSVALGAVLVVLGLWFL